MSRLGFALRLVLEAVRILVVFGFVLVLGASPFNIQELGNFGCNTSWNPDGEPTIEDDADDFSLVSAAAVLSVIMFCAHAPLGRPNLAFMAFTAALPVGWTAFVLTIAATPDCSDDVLLHDRQTPFTTMPDGALVLTTADTVIDDATRAMAFGVALIGWGSAILAMEWAVDAPRRFWSSKGGQSKESAYIRASVVGVALILYVVGGAFLYVKTTESTDWHWSKLPQNEARVEGECTSGSGAVFDKPLAATDRTALFDLVTAAFFCAVAVTGVCALVGLVLVFVRPSARVSTYLGSACGALFVATHAVMTAAIVQVVYTGINPQCTEYLFATSRPAADGLLTVTIGMTAMAMFTLVATARDDASTSSDEAFSWRTRWAFRSRPDITRADAGMQDHDGEYDIADHATFRVIPEWDNTGVAPLPSPHVRSANAQDYQLPVAATANRVIYDERGVPHYAQPLPPPPPLPSTGASGDNLNDDSDDLPPPPPEMASAVDVTSARGSVSVATGWDYAAVTAAAATEEEEHETSRDDSADDANVNRSGVAPQVPPTTTSEYAAPEGQEWTI